MAVKRPLGAVRAQSTVAVALPKVIRMLVSFLLRYLSLAIRVGTTQPVPTGAADRAGSCLSATVTS
jgi:hypothetical protein